MTARDTQDIARLRGPAGGLPESRGGAVVAPPSAPADDRRLAEWRERALAAEARVSELEQTQGVLLDLLPGVEVLGNGMVVT